MEMGGGEIQAKMLRVWIDMRGRTGVKNCIEKTGEWCTTGTITPTFSRFALLVRLQFHQSNHYGF